MAAALAPLVLAMIFAAVLRVICALEATWQSGGRAAHGAACCEREGVVSPFLWFFTKKIGFMGQIPVFFQREKCQLLDKKIVGFIWRGGPRALWACQKFATGRMSTWGEWES